MLSDVCSAVGVAQLVNPLVTGYVQLGLSRQEHSGVCAHIPTAGAWELIARLWGNGHQIVTVSGS